MQSSLNRKEESSFTTTNYNTDLIHQGSLVPAGSRQYHISLHHKASPERFALKQLIHHRFAQTYGADVRAFMPWLVALSSKERPSIVAGFRSAEKEPLFTEQYLDDPIEAVIACQSGKLVSRHQIVEIGNLAGSQPGMSRLFFLMLNMFLNQIGFKWVVFAATATVETMLKSMRFHPITLCDAVGDKLGEQMHEWGSYYETHPKVLTGYLPSAMEHVNSLPWLQEMTDPYACELMALQDQFERASKWD